MQLLDELQSVKFSLTDITYEMLDPNRLRDLNVALSEALARQRLSKIDGIEFLKVPITAGQYTLKRRAGDITFEDPQKHSQRQIGALEEIFTYKNTHFGLEVKSAAPFGYVGLDFPNMTPKIETHLQLLLETFGPETQLLLCFPFSRDSEQKVRKKVQDYPKVICYDLNYTKEELKRQMEYILGANTRKIK